MSTASSRQGTSAAALDNLKRDRFELLSAYIDGEVTVSERRQVEQWLETDQNMRCLYSRLLKLRQGLRTMAVPASETSVEQTIESVYRKANRRPKVIAAWVGSALALLSVSFFSSDLNLRFANTLPDKAESSTEVLEDSSPALEMDVNTPLLGPAVSGMTGSEEGSEQFNKDVSKDDLMLQLDAPVVPIPKLDDVPQADALESLSGSQPKSNESLSD